MVAPKALNTDTLPSQMVSGLASAVMLGVGTTVTVIVVKLVQPKGEVPFTVYVCVLDGLAFTLAPTVALKAVFGDHV